MRAVLRSAARRQRRGLLTCSYFRPPSLCLRYRSEPIIILTSPFCLSALDDFDEDTDIDYDTIVRLDTQLLFERFNVGLNDESIESREILDIVDKLSAAGVTIPISFMFDAGEHKDVTVYADMSRSIKRFHVYRENFAVWWRRQRWRFRMIVVLPQYQLCYYPSEFHDGLTDKWWQ